jgi:hypothetical protein
MYAKAIVCVNNTSTVNAMSRLQKQLSTTRYNVTSVFIFIEFGQGPLSGDLISGRMKRLLGLSQTENPFCKQNHHTVISL